MFDKYLEEKMIIRIQIWKDVFLKHLHKDSLTTSKTLAADIADEAVKRFEKACKEEPE